VAYTRIAYKQGFPATAAQSLLTHNPCRLLLADEREFEHAGVRILTFPGEKVKLL